jgi:hypothetical protein
MGEPVNQEHISVPDGTRYAVRNLAWMLAAPVGKSCPSKAEREPQDEAARPTLHYGPEWSWDQSRPEAIEARRQAEEFHKAIRSARPRQQA